MNSSDVKMDVVEKILSNRSKLSLLLFHPNVVRLRQNHALIRLLTVNFIKLTNQQSRSLVLGCTASTQQRSRLIRLSEQ